MLGTGSFGLYSAMLSFSLIPSMLMDLGINQFNTGQISRNPGLSLKNLKQYLPVKISLGLMYLAISIPMGWYIYKDATYDEKFELLIILLINQVLAGFILFIRTFFSGLHWFTTDAVFSVTDKLIMIILGWILIHTNWLGELSLVRFAACQTIAYMITLIAGASILVPRLKNIPIPKIRKPFGIHFLKRTWPYALLALLMIIYMRGDIVLLEMMSEDGEIQVGKYILSFRLLDAVNMVAVLTASLFFPIFSRLLKRNESLHEIIYNGFFLLVFPVGILWIFLFYHGYPLLQLLYQNRADQEAISLLPWVMASVVPMCFNYIYGTLLTANKQLRNLNVVSFIAVVLMVVGNFFLSPYYKAMGTAITALMVHVFIACIQYSLIQKIPGAFLPAMAWLKLLLGWGLVGISIWFMNKVGLSWIQQILPVGFCLPICWFGLRMIHPKTIKGLFHSRLSS